MCVSFIPESPPPFAVPPSSGRKFAVLISSGRMEVRAKGLCVWEEGVESHSSFVRGSSSQAEAEQQQKMIKIKKDRAQDPCRKERIKRTEKECACEKKKRRKKERRGWREKERGNLIKFHPSAPGQPPQSCRASWRSPWWRSIPRRPVTSLLHRSAQTPSNSSLNEL